MQATRFSRYVAILIIIVSIAMGPNFLFSQVSGEIVQLSELIKVALEKNPRIKSLYIATQADSARIEQSATLPDPVLSLSLLNLPTNSFAFDQEPMTGKQIALRQKFPFPGKLSLQKRISARGTEIAVAKYREYVNQIQRDIKLAYYDLYYLDKAIEITGRNRLLLEKFARIAQTKYAVGNGLQQDVLKAQVEFSKMKDKLIGLKQQRKVKATLINTLINAPVRTKVGKTADLHFMRITAEFDSLKIIADKHRPLFAAWGSQKKRSDLQVDLAKKDYWPDLTVFMAYTQRDELQNGNPGYDFLSGGVSLNIPLYSGSKQSRKVAEMSFTRQAIEQSYHQVLNQVYSDLENTLANSKKNAELIHLYKNEILPQAAQSVESALIGYQTDKVDFLTLMNNQIMRFNYELDHHRALRDYHKDMASLEFIVGKELVRNE